MSEKIDRVDHEAFFRSPQDYSMPDKSGISTKSCKLSTGSIEVINNQFNIGYGMAMDFNNRLTALNSINKAIPKTKITQLSDISKVILHNFTNTFTYDFLMYDFIDKIKLPEIPSRAIKILYDGNKFTIKSFAEGLIETLPLLYIVSLDVNKRLDFVNNLKNIPLKMGLSIFEEIEIVAEQVFNTNAIIHSKFQTNFVNLIENEW